MRQKFIAVFFFLEQNQVIESRDSDPDLQKENSFSYIIRMKMAGLTHASRGYISSGETGARV
jgi:hypothetical protein